MPAFTDKQELAPAGSTGANTHAVIQLPASAEAIAGQFVVEAAGATPTIGFKLQGSFDGTNFFDLATLQLDSSTVAVSRTVTAVGAYGFALEVSRMALRYLRLVTSANTNITYRCEAYGKDSAA